MESNSDTVWGQERTDAKPAAIYQSLHNRSRCWKWIEYSHEGPQQELTLPCLCSDNGSRKWRPPLILACKSQASNGLHLEGSEFTTGSLWKRKVFPLRCVGGLIKGSGSCRPRPPTLARRPAKMARACTEIRACHRLGFRGELGSNGDWQAFCWALLPHASSNPAAD